MLYVNDLHKALNEAQCIFFADDANIFIEHKELTQIANIMITELSSLSYWLTTDKLTLNINKTHYMVFHRAS